MEEICENLAETRCSTRVSAVGLVTFTRVSVAAVTAEPYHFFTCFRQVSVEGKQTNVSASVTSCQHVRKHIVTWRKHEFFIFPSTSSYLNVHGNTRSRSGNTFFSCFRRRNQTERRRKYWVTFRKQIFVLFLLTNSDLEWTETLDFVPETLFFLVSSIYRTLSALVIRDLPFSLQDR